MGSDGDGSSSGEDGDHQKWLKILHEQNLHTAVGELRKKRAQVEYAEADLEVKRANVVYFERMVELQKGGFIPPVGSLQVPLQPDVSVFPSSKRKGAQNPGGRTFQIFSQTTLKQTHWEQQISPANLGWSYHDSTLPGEDFYCRNCTGRIAVMDPFLTHRVRRNEDGDDDDDGELKEFQYHAGFYCLGFPLEDRESFLAADFGDGRGPTLQNFCEDYWRKTKQYLRKSSGKSEAGEDDEIQDEAD